MERNRIRIVTLRESDLSFLNPPSQATLREIYSCSRQVDKGYDRNTE